MEYERTDPHPFKTLINAKRKDLALSKIEREMTPGCEDAYAEALRAVRELGLPGVGVEAFMYGLIREWNGVRFIYDTRRSSHYPDRDTIEKEARKRIEELRGYIKAEWDMAIEERDTLSPGVDKLAALMFSAEQSASSQNFPQITTGNIFEALFLNDFHARRVALGETFTLTEIKRSLGKDS